jgi:CBS domain containing-hemolysin-like protein
MCGKISYSKKVRVQLKGNILPHAIKNGILIGFGTLVLSVIFNLGSQFMLDFLDSIVFKFILLFIIILIGVFFDIIGVSAAAASEGPAHAQAATRIFGARQAVKIIRNADRVSSFCNDVVGDVCGILSGAIGTAILFELIFNNAGVEDLVFSTLMTASIASLTVGGKAAGKSLAIANANDIILKVGMFIAVIERTLGITLFGSGVKKGRTK